VWELLNEWLGIHGLHPRHWAGLSTQDWWSLLVEGLSPHRKGFASLALLTIWEIWKERNARVFRHKLLPTFVTLDKIKRESRLWVLARAKRLGNMIPRE
jgi:hypothetical protein